MLPNKICESCFLWKHSAVLQMHQFAQADPPGSAVELIDLRRSSHLCRTGGTYVACAAWQRYRRDEHIATSIQSQRGFNCSTGKRHSKLKRFVILSGQKVSRLRSNMGVEPKIGVGYPQNHPFVHRGFPLFSPSILGVFPLFLVQHGELENGDSFAASVARCLDHH